MSLIASYPSKASDVAADDEHRRGGSYRSPFRDRSPGEFEAACWFDSRGFGIAAPVQPNDAAANKAGPQRREEIVRPDGVPVVEAQGQKADLTPAPVPASGGGQ